MGSRRGPRGHSRCPGMWGAAGRHPGSSPLPYILHCRTICMAAAVLPWRGLFSWTLREAWGGGAVGWNSHELDRKSGAQASITDLL